MATKKEGFDLSEDVIFLMAYDDFDDILPFEEAPAADDLEGRDTLDDLDAFVLGSALFR